MPSSEAILNMAFALANEWRWVAIVWHVAFVIAAIMALGGARVSQRTAAVFLTLPIISVSLLAWSAGNPFNGLVFMVLVQLMAGLATTLGPQPIAVDSAVRNRAVGGALVIFGLSYPHFLIADSWLVYLYAAPFGLIPCPTIAVVTGVSLILGSFGSRAWAIVVSVVALAYGIIGVVALHVWIDTFLIAGGLLLLETCLSVKARRLVAT